MRPVKTILSNNRIPLDYVLNINAYDVSNADALVQQTEKIEAHGNKHAHQITHVSRLFSYLGVKFL